MNLSIVVITNKDKLPEIFLRRLTFASEIIFVHESKKPILEIPLKNSVFLATSHQINFANKRNLGLEKAKSDWVIFIDDDEIVSSDLAEEIKEKTKTKIYSGYYLTRHDLCFYQELKYGEIKNQKILRLAKRGAGEFARSVHEVWNISGAKGYLVNTLYHQKDNFTSQFINRIRQYGPLDAQSQVAEKKYFSYFRLLFLPKLKFLNNYFLKKGFKDGLPGLFLAYLMSIQSLSVRIYQWEKTLK